MIGTAHKLKQRIDSANSLLCVGLDPVSNDQLAFNQETIDATHTEVCAYKLNTAFYEAKGGKGIVALQETIRYLRKKYPEIVTIIDAKRGDVPHTNKESASFVFDVLQGDAVTLSPYLGLDALEPFLSREDRLPLIVCRTSNSGSDEFQSLSYDGRPLWRSVAEKAAVLGKHVGLVIGAQNPEELREARGILGERTFLIPGVGAQGGNVDGVVKFGKNKNGAGLIISSSRAIIFAEDPEEAARRLKEEINQYR